MYRKFFVAVMAVAMLAAVAGPALADPPIPGGDKATGEAITEGLPPATAHMNGPEDRTTIHMYSWLNLGRSKLWNLRGKSHVFSEAYNASSHGVNMIVKNRLCRGGSCTVWGKTSGSNLVWARAAWAWRGSRANWTTRGIHTFYPFGRKRTFRTLKGAPL